MPTFVDPVADVAEAYEGLRGLAHATRSFEDPADTFRVLAEVSGSVRLLRQVLDQVSRAHADHRERAFTDDGLGAEQIALLAADELHQAADVLDGVEDRVLRAHEASGRIAWHDQPAPEQSRQWVSVVFLQGSEADEVLDLIDREGTQAAIAYLAQWDFGEETTNAALVNGDVYDQFPAGGLDQVAEHDGYTLTFNPAMGYVGLVREHPIPVEAPESEVSVVPARDAISGIGGSPRRATGTDWFARPAARLSGDSVGRSL